MNKLTCTVAAVLTTSGFSVADVLIDQIGDMDGTGIADNIMASQDFEAGFDVYDVVIADNFTGDGASIANVEMVLGGWNGFTDPSSVSGYSANLYSNPDAAGASLTGDLASEFVDAADATTSPDWAGANFLIGMGTNLASSTGTQYFGLIPSNDFATGGQTGCADTNLGDGVAAIQANPGGGFGFGAWQDAPGEAAYRLHNDGVVDPCNFPLPESCTADVDGDMIVAVSDLLTIIGNWGECGDGTFRPIGDVAPMPNGDCCVNVGDLLTVIGAWGDDCTPKGACCSDAGLCSDDTTPDDCLASGGVYLGDGSLCSDGDCISGACCIDTLTCLDGVSPWYCTDFGGSFRGEGSVCADVSCEANCQAAGCQLADLGGHGADGIIGATSDTNPDAGYIVADTFNPTASGVVSNVCWWGMYIDFSGPSDCGATGPGTGDSFTISYYLDDSSSAIPGTLLAGPFEVSASVNATGDVIPSSIGDIVQYEYSASHPAVNVESGSCYWISISNQTTATCFWLWETAPPGDSRSAQDNGGWGESDYDLAFCVDIDIAADACGIYTGPCCFLDDTCEMMSAADCLAAEGEYKGDNLTCADVNDCLPIPGACCFADSCLDNTTDQDCAAFGGLFMGDGTDCNNVECANTDQVGPSDGSMLDGNITASQIFEAANEAYNIATLDNFSFDSETTITSIEAVIDGWNGYSDISSITNYTVSIYSSTAAAGGDLVGEVYSVDIVTPDILTWTGEGELIGLNVNVVLPAGEYYFAVIPWNDFSTAGQTGIAGSTLGDGSFWQANPNGGFGFGTVQEGTGNAAYRINTQ